MVHTLIRVYRRLRYPRYGWFGNYASWQEARQKATGYDAEAVLEKIRNATLKVKNGEAAWEQDGVIYPRVQHSWPLLAHLLWIAGQHNNRLSVLDFGGSLGSGFFQNRAWFRPPGDLQWSIVEQTHFVRAGQAAIAGDGLQFYYTIEEAIAARGMPQVFLMGCVLPYLEDPYAFLEKTMEHRFPYIIVDNTYFNSRTGDRLTLQKVPAYYYKASYPAWMLNYEKIKALLLTRYELVEEYTNETFLYFYGEKINYRGFAMKLR